MFVRKKHIEMGDLYEAPFTNFGINAPVPLFDEGDLQAFIEAYILMGWRRNCSG